MKNKREAKCVECHDALFPGEGEKWLDALPPWAKHGGYLCERCWKLWLSWVKIKPQTDEDMLRCQLWIATKVPAEGKEVIRMGMPEVMDVRSILQDHLYYIVYKDSGLAASLIARNIANFLESMDEKDRSEEELTKIMVYVREVTISRLDKKGIYYGGRAKWTQNQAA